MNLINGFNYFKKIQGTKYDRSKIDIRENLSTFRKTWKNFTNSIADENNLLIINNGIGNWLKTNGTTIQEYLWNRYKVSDDNTSLVIYFNASSKKKEGIFVSIGLIDDKCSEYEKEKSDEIYTYLEEECSTIECQGFKKNNGSRAFKIINESKYEEADYECLLNNLKIVYKNTLNKFYKSRENTHHNGEEMKSPLNQILYGPPGTGKTYNTINKALEIVENRKFSQEELDDRTTLKEKFDGYRESGEIEFITFHQSYGYEEFVEGIKAKTNEETKAIEYSVEAGIFKTLCDKAATKGSSNLEEKIEWLKEELVDGQSIDIIYNKSNFNVSYRDGKTFRIKPMNTKNEKADYPASIENIKKIYKGGKKSEIYNPTYTVGILEYLYKHGLNKYDEIKDENQKKYILIIDEINRGNISKIFGELITLIEPSKRIGADEEIRLTLPNSPDTSFGVPSNLYIIGTMNTADRSIAQIDTALRRRFVFEEMMPKPELLEKIEIFDNKIKIDINVTEILNAINERIEYIYDREHTIGHSYFMDLLKKGCNTKDKLDEIFRINIIPLLAEYFYGDWNDIKIILNDIKDKGEFITKRDKPIYKLADTKSNNQIFTVNMNDMGKSNFSIDGYKNIYQKVKEDTVTSDG